MGGSSLESMRKLFIPKVPACLMDIVNCSLEPAKKDLPCLNEIAKLFPHSSTLPFLNGSKSLKNEPKRLKIGVVFSGGQAPGGHNVISGLFDAIQKLGKEGELIGFLDGPGGIVSGSYKTLSANEVDRFRNTGGFHLLGSGRDKIETSEQLKSAQAICQKLQLDGLVIVGGDDSNTNAAILAEYFHQNGCQTSVVGVPKTIDGDLKNAFVPISFGFDSATKLYSELIGNLAQDALSAKKYTHFIRLMGRAASHITLECALLTHPNYALIAEEVCEQKKTLSEIVSDLCDLIEERSRLGKSYGIFLIPEGLIEFIPEVSLLIQEINLLLSKGVSFSELEKKLTEPSLLCYQSLPELIQKQLLLVRDPHGNVQLSLIETERLLAEMVSIALQKREFKGSFHPQTHFFGYEGRSGFPSNFDASYCYTLGQVAALLVSSKASGYMSVVLNLQEDILKWEIGAVPLTALMHIEMRKGKLKPVIQKALVDLKGSAFETFKSQRESWRLKDLYRIVGPMQFHEEYSIPLTLSLENRPRSQANG